MALIARIEHPKFRVSRISHIVLTVTDLPKSLSFYEELIGLVRTDSDGRVAYLRGVEETCHHSLVLKQANAARAEGLGFRVASELDLEIAFDELERMGAGVSWTEVPHQGRTLRCSDPGGVPLELCATMPVAPRLGLDFAQHVGAAPTRIDHAQVHVTDPDRALPFYVDLGFRVSEFANERGTPDDPLEGVFVAVKGDMIDLAIFRNRGPRLHHFAFTVHDASSTLPRLCDRATSLGLRDSVDYGPGRHGLAPQQFLYLRDPDGHRVELVSPAYQLLDPETEPIGWRLDDPRAVTQWGPFPRQDWWEEATPFTDVAVNPVRQPGAGPGDGDTEA